MPSLAEIYLARGRSESDAELRKAAIEAQRGTQSAALWGNTIANLANTAGTALTEYGRQKQNAPLIAAEAANRQKQGELLEINLAGAKRGEAAAAAEPGLQQTAMSILAKARRQNPQTGAPEIDQDALLAGLTEAGMANRYETLKPIVESYQKNATEAAARQAAAMKDMAGLVADGGYHAEDFAMGVDDLVQRGLMSETYAIPLLKRAKEDPNFVKNFTMRVTGQQDKGPLVTKPGDVLRDPNDPSKVLATNPATPPTVAPPAPFTLSPGQKRYGADGKLIASSAPNTPEGEQVGPTPTVNPNAPHGDDYMKTLPEQRQQMIKSLAEGRQPFPSGMALRTPYWQGLLNDVFQYDPTFDTALASNNARVKVRQDFTSGKSAGQVNALNTVIGHLGTLTDAADGLSNVDTQFVNTIKNWAKSQTGNPSVTNFDTAKEAVASELVRVWRQAGGSTQDVQDWKKTLDSSQSPAQLKSNIAQIGHLLESKLESMQEQYQQGMGTSGIRLLTPESRTALDKMEGKPAQTFRADANVPPQVLSAGPGQHTFANGQVWIVSPDGKSAMQVKK